MITRWLFARLDPRATPIFHRLTRHQAWPSLNLTVGLGGVLFAASTVGSALFFSRSLVYTPTTILLLRIEAILVPLAVVGLLTVPFVIAIIAALVAASEKRSEAFQLLGLTNVTTHALSQGIALAVLFRLRVLVALTAALIPIAVGGFARAAVLANVNMPSPAPSLPSVAVTIITFAGLGSAWGMSFPVAGIGAHLGLSARSVLFGVIAILIILLVWMLGPQIMLLTLFNLVSIRGMT